MEQQVPEMSRSRRSTVRRCRDRASYVYEDALQLLDELKLGHVGFRDGDHMTVIPMTLWRVEQHLYLHTMNKSRLQRLLEAGSEVCISLAQCTEWVLAKSAYHHSANYQSAVLYCRGERVTDSAQFDAAFAAVINDLEADRWQQVRPPNASERKATALMKLTIVEGSFKARNGGPNEEPEDMSLPVWHGTLPACPIRHGG